MQECFEGDVNLYLKKLGLIGLYYNSAYNKAIWRIIHPFLELDYSSLQKQKTSGYVMHGYLCN